jgi:hypothetical protein
MALLPQQARVLAELCREHKIKGSVITLGRNYIFLTLKQCLEIAEEIGFPRTQRMDDLISSYQYLRDPPEWSIFMNGEMINDIFYFATLGFHTVDCVDIRKSDTEKPTVIFDLNETGIDAVVDRKYELVMDAGVMEHVFDVRSVMNNITDLVTDDGYIIHILPANNAMDHGFYQFSPTLFRDYYTANKYEIITISILEFVQNKYLPPGTPFVERWDFCRIIEYDPDVAIKNSYGQLSDCIYMVLVCVRKTSESTRDELPTQSVRQPVKSPIVG